MLRVLVVRLVFRLVEFRLVMSRSVAHLSVSVCISQISVRRTRHTFVGPPHDHATIPMQKGSLKTSAIKTATLASCG